MKLPHYSFPCLFSMAFLFSAFIAADEKKETGRTIDAGVLADKRYPANYFKVIDRYTAKLNSLGMKPEKVSADIFLSGNKAERDKYKRILILYYFIFSPDVYDGMKDYVKSGGLLITNSSMPYMDMNNNYVYDKNTDREIKNLDRIHGIHAHATVKLQDFTIQMECPLTKGFAIDKTYESSLNMSETKNVGANVLITGTAFRVWGDEKNKKAALKELPVLAFKQMGNGAFIYIGIPDNEEIFKNCFSAETLEWLTND